MPAEVRSEVITYGEKSAQLISVRHGEAAIGTCFAGYTGIGGTGAVTRLFFIGGEPISVVICPNNDNKQSNKLISIAPAFKNYDQKIYNVLGNSIKRINAGESLANGLRDIMGLLEDGVYTVYAADYYPTDGAGSFFWGAYNIPHEVQGTAEKNRFIGTKSFKPCFLVPSQPLEYFTKKMKTVSDESSKRREIQGIAYHLSGFHSVLLKGHHGAVSCLENDIPFRCAVIEKVCEPYVETLLPPPPPAPAAEAAEGEAEVAETAQPVQAAQEAPVFVPEGITGFRSPSLKVPIELFPKEMLKLVLEGRPEYKPKQFASLIAKINVSRKKTVSNNILPLAVLEKADQLPDYEMVESAYAVNSLSDEQLNCLLAGDVECKGEVIISPNFYQSIVTACNFLQFTDTKRFVDFTIAVMENPELSATHEYVAKRALTQLSSKKLYKFFTDAVASGDAQYEKIVNFANTFISRYKETS